jgi:hypothetical protein
LITVPDGASLRWRRAAVFALLAWTVLGQVGAIVHRVNHETIPHAGTCLLCVAADHLAAPITEHLAVFTPYTPALEPADLEQAHSVAPSQPYQSRAPPLRS